LGVTNVSLLKPHCETEIHCYILHSEFSSLAFWLLNCIEHLSYHLLIQRQGLCQYKYSFYNQHWFFSLFLIYTLLTHRY